MDTVISRMRFIMELNDWSEREWCRRAEIKEPSNVNKLLRRMSEDPSRVSGDAKTFAKLAKAAGVSLDWLLLGVGTPTPESINFSGDGLYPTRPRVLLGAYVMGFPRAAIDAVLAHNELESDPGWEYWVRLLQVEQAKLAAPAAQHPPQLGQ